ncbi:11042_t:CDS:2, partial [Acaulospora colombiana]
GQVLRSILVPQRCQPFAPLTVNTNSHSSAPVPHSPASPSPRTPKQESNATSKQEQEALRSPISPTSANQKTSLPVTSASPLSLWHFLSDLPSRVHGPRQNLYLLAFYFCIATLITFLPFTYHFVWYIDTPRIEFVATLYLAAVLQDSKNVPGLSNKEKVNILFIYYSACAELSLAPKRYSLFPKASQSSMACVFLGTQMIWSTEAAYASNSVTVSSFAWTFKGTDCNCLFGGSSFWPSGSAIDWGTSRPFKIKIWPSTTIHANRFNFVRTLLTRPSVVDHYSKGTW